MNLVVQGEDIATSHLKELAHLTGAEGIEQITTQAFRLRRARLHDGVAGYCLERRMDCGYVPEGRRLADFGLFVADMDSTLITIECIDEIADMQGLKPQVAAITESAMRGEIEFAESLTRRVALLAGLEETALARVYDERLRLSPGVERLMAGLRRAGLATVLVSGGFTFFTERLKARLGFDEAYSNSLEVRDGRLTGRVSGPIVDGAEKLRRLIDARERRGLVREQVIAMGDGANDVPMLGEAAVGIAYRAKPVVRERASYALNFVGVDGVLNLFE